MGISEGQAFRFGLLLQLLLLRPFRRVFSLQSASACIWACSFSGLRPSLACVVSSGCAATLLLRRAAPCGQRLLLPRALWEGARRWTCLKLVGSAF